MNGHLKNLESTHHFLATLFTKTLLSSPTPWEGWGLSSIVLIHKGGETGDPSNFRPIALTSCVGKVFHQILSDRITKFLLGNGYLDSKTQKAFLSRISGCQDHREKIEDYLRFLTHAGATRFSIFACESLPKLCHFVNTMSPMLTLTLKIV